ncbi:MAG: NTP transferase domain-containing protein [Gammaproteobacteria bacterium]
MPYPPPGLRGLVLAAGASRRFGSPKQLALIDGVPMLQRVIETAQAALPPRVLAAGAGTPVSRITVVLGAHAEAVRAGVIEQLAPPQPEVVVCPDWERGMAHSLRRGLAASAGAVPGHGSASAADAPSAALVLLGDTPFITADDLRRLIDAWCAAPETPAAAAYDGTIGAPCILPRAVWQEVMTLEGDRGAGAWLRARDTEGLAVIRTSIVGAARDIDSPR